MGFQVWTYFIYGFAAITLTGALARSLFANGTLFLESVFEDKPGMAAAVNRLLVTGFYMLNLGYALSYSARTTRSKPSPSWKT